MISHRPQEGREKAITKTLCQYHLDFSKSEILSSVVKAWCISNEISFAQAERGQGLAQVLSARVAGDLHLRLLRSGDALSLKEVEVAFETFIDAHRKRAEGVVYTPEFVVDYLIERCLALWTEQKLPLLIDPACGSGGFLVRAVPVLASRFGISPERVINELVYGVDINPESIKCARLMLEMFCIQNRVSIPPTFNHLWCGDTLLCSRSSLLQVLGIQNDGFDVITSNPPYVKIQDLDPSYRAALHDVYPEFTDGSFNLSQLFLVNCHQLLSPEGVMGTITPNNLFTALSSEEVRNYLQQKKCLHSIIDFGHQKIFRNASTYTCLLFLDRSSHDHLLYAQCNDAPSKLDSLIESDFDPIEVTPLRKEKWRLAAVHHLHNIHRLERYGTPLGSLADIRVGFATLKDSVFLLDHSPAHAAIEAGITTSAIKVASFASEDELTQNRRRIIQPYSKKGDRWLPYSEEELRDRFPCAFSYLQSHRPALEARDKGKKSEKNFFEWGRTQGMEAPGPKLLTKTFSRSPQFLLDETDSLFCNGYSVKPKEQSTLFSSSMNIRTLQKLLNSCVMNYYIRLTSVSIEGDYQCYQKNFIERFCVPEITIEDEESLFLLEGEHLQRFICNLFGLRFAEIEEVISS